MSKHDREHEHEGDHGEDRPRVKVTDKRRIHLDDPAGHGGHETPPAVEPGAGPVRGVAEGIDERDRELAEARKQADEYRELLQRMQAEFDNYRKRVLREQTSTLELAAEPVMRRLLEVLDEFELALLHAHEDVDRDRFLKGIELVYAKLMDALKSEGLQRIDAEGAPFDPNLHEALMQTGDGSGEPHVAEVFRPGYTLKGRVLRPAGVRVERT